MNAIVDASPLIALFDHDAVDRTACLAVFERPDLDLVVAALPLAEACYMVASRLGADAEHALLRFVRRYPIESPTAEDLDRMSELVLRYRNFPLGASDASLVALAERFETPYVVTLDQRHFRSIRPNHVAAFELLPG